MVFALAGRDEERNCKDKYPSRSREHDCAPKPAEAITQSGQFRRGISDLLSRLQRPFSPKAEISHSMREITRFSIRVSPH